MTSGHLGNYTILTDVTLTCRNLLWYASGSRANVELEARMAKKLSKGTGTSKVRFIMLEAEMPEGDLAQITTAIQNALRPAQSNGPRLARGTTQVIGQSDLDGEDVIDASDYADDPEDEAAAVPNSAPKSRKPAKPAKRKVVEIDLDSDVSLASYADKYPPKTEQDHYLLAVAYLCENRKDIEGVTADHVYTCFRKMNWSTGSKDFAQPLRNLKSKDLLDSGKSRGTYAVNHIGLDKVHKFAEG